MFILLFLTFFLDLRIIKVKSSEQNKKTEK